LDHTLIDSTVLLYKVLLEVEAVVPMVGEEVEEVEEVEEEVAPMVGAEVEEVVEEVVRKVVLPDFRLLDLHVMVFHRKVVLLRKVVLPPVVLLMVVLRVEGAVVAEKWVELLLGPKYFG